MVGWKYACVLALLRDTHDIDTRDQRYTLGVGIVCILVSINFLTVRAGCQSSADIQCSDILAPGVPNLFPG